MLHAFAHALENAAGMQQAGRQGFLMEGRGEAEDVRITDEFRAEARAHRVAVHAHDARQRPAVGIEGGGAVVGFHLDAGIVIFRKGDDPRVVLEHRMAEIPVAEAGADLPGGVHDAGFVEAVDGFGRAAFRIGIGDFGGENLVFAVLGPRLCENFEFGVRGIGGQAESLTRGRHFRAGEPVPDFGHFRKVEGQRVLAAHVHEGFIVHRGEGDDGDVVTGSAGYAGRAGGKSGLCVPLRPALDVEALDQFVGEEVAGDARNLLLREIALNAVLDGGIDGEAATIVDAEHEGGRCGLRYRSRRDGSPLR